MTAFRPTTGADSTRRLTPATTTHRLGPSMPTRHPTRYPTTRPTRHPTGARNGGLTRESAIAAQPAVPPAGALGSEPREPTVLGVLRRDQEGDERQRRQRQTT